MPFRCMRGDERTVHRSVLNFEGPSNYGRGYSSERAVRMLHYVKWDLSVCTPDFGAQGGLRETADALLAPV